jgi:hypothetical protein
MPFKNEEARLKNYRERYLAKYGHYPKPLVRKTKEEKLAVKRAWALANKDKEKAYAEKSREKHKEQRRLDNKLWVEKNKDYYLQYHRKYNKKWYKENKESNHQRSLKWARNNPERFKEIKKKFMETHPEDVKAGLIRYRKTLKGRYRVLKGSAVKRGYLVGVNFEQFCKIISNPCAYCGENEKRIGIDRVDNKIGYTLENCVPCCNPCNMMKKIMNVDDFLGHIKRVNTFQESKRILSAN